MKYFWYNPHVNIKFGKLDYKYHLDDWTIIECNIGRINFEYCLSINIGSDNVQNLAREF